MNIIPSSNQPPPPPPRRRGKSLTKTQNEDIKEDVKEIKEQIHLPLVRKDCTIYIEFHKK